MTVALVQFKLESHIVSSTDTSVTTTFLTFPPKTNKARGCDTPLTEPLSVGKRFSKNVIYPGVALPYKNSATSRVLSFVLPYASTG